MTTNQNQIKWVDPFVSMLWLCFDLWTKRGKNSMKIRDFFVIFPVFLCHGQKKIVIIHNNRNDLRIQSLAIYHAQCFKSFSYIVYECGADYSNWVNKRANIWRSDVCRYAMLNKIKWNEEEEEQIRRCLTRSKENDHQQLNISNTHTHNHVTYIT